MFYMRFMWVVKLELNWYGTFATVLLDLPSWRLRPHALVGC